MKTLKSIPFGRLFNRKNRNLFAAVAFLLVFTMVLLHYGPVIQILAESKAPQTEYVSDVRMYTADTPQEAKEMCTKDGYIPVDGDLNTGAEGGSVILGYQTTKDADQAVTDVRMMQMTSGFSTINYYELVERQYPQLDGFIADEYATINEFADRLDKGSRNAEIARDYLNLFTIPETGKLLGDYFVGGSVDQKTLKKLFLQSTAVVTTTILGQLTLGVSDDPDNTWASRVYGLREKFEDDQDDKRNKKANEEVNENPEDVTDPESPEVNNNPEEPENPEVTENPAEDAETTEPEEVLTTPESAEPEEDEEEPRRDPYAELDKKYLDDTERLVTVIQDYATKYQTAIVRAESNGGEIPEISPDEATAEEMNEKGTDSIYVLAHDMLNQFRYSDEIQLGDWLVDMGCLKLADKKELRQLYPLTAAMTNGQIITTELTGICSSAFYLFDLSSQEGELNKKLKEAKAACRELEGKDVISVWSGVDQDMFSKTVAVTGDAQRYTNIKNTADNMVKRNKVIQVLENVSSIAQTASKIAGGVVALLMIPNAIVQAVATDAALWYCQHFTTYMVFACMGKVAAVLTAITTIVLIVAIVIMVIVWLYETFKPECDELDYTAIPEIAMDLSTDDNLSGSNGLLRYDLIRDPDGKGDVNAYNGKQWNALYYSKNTESGRPITVPEDKSAFIVQVGNSVNPEGYAPVRNFDEIYAANLNANVKNSDASQIYLFYSSPGTKANTTAVRDGEDDQESENQELDMPDGYISTLYLSCADNETEAKLNLTKKGYKTIDVNLSPSTGDENIFGTVTKKMYTYLGYTVTKNKDAAVTDIRMVRTKSTSQAVMYGNVKYTAAGYDARENSICYTKDESAGSPIRADRLQVLDSISEAKKESEPVCYLGGPAYNFDQISDNTRWDKSRYIFFTPSDADAKGKEYISGLFFVAGRDAKESGYSLEDFAERLGGVMLSADLTKGKVWKESVAAMGRTATIEIEDFRTYLCYTTTHDPKRAIYDIKLYTGTPKMMYFLPTITAMTESGSGDASETGYSVSTVFIQDETIDGSLSGDGRKKFMYHKEQSVFNDFLVEQGRANRYFGQTEDNSLPGVKWDAVNWQPKALYVSGVKKGCEPLTVKDILLSGGDAPSGFTSVRDFKFPYEKNPIRMSYFFSPKANKCSKTYLYIRGTAPEKGKYIASLSLAAYSPDSDRKEEERAAGDMLADDLCYITLLSQSSGGIINRNLEVNPSEAWYNAADEFNGYGTNKYPAKAAYLGVSYTNDPRKAIHGIIKKTADDEGSPKDTIKVSGATYSLVKNLSGSKATPVTSPNGRKYYLYTSTSAGASPAAAPITDINVSESVFESGMATVLTVDKGDTTKQTDRYGNVLEDEQLVTPYGDKNEALFMHVNTAENLLGIDTFYVGTGWSNSAAQADLLSQGAVYCLPLDLSKGMKKSPCVYLGYSKYDPEFTKTKRTKYYMELAIKDLYVYQGDDPQRSIKVDGNKYTLVSKTSLSDKEPMYLYQTTALINDKNQEDASYITSVAAAQYDRVPKDVAENRWENLLTTDKVPIDLNYGGVAWDDTEEMHITDSRIHVFVHRNDNYIKPEGAITGGYTTDRTDLGDLVLNK